MPPGVYSISVTPSLGIEKSKLKGASARGFSSTRSGGEGVRVSGALDEDGEGAAVEEVSEAPDDDGEDAAIEEVIEAARGAVRCCEAVSN